MTAVEGTRTSSARVDSASAEVVAMTDRLRGTVEGFLKKVAQD